MSSEVPGRTRTKPGIRSGKRLEIIKVGKLVWICGRSKNITENVFTRRSSALFSQEHSFMLLIFAASVMLKKISIFLIANLEAQSSPNRRAWHYFWPLAPWQLRWAPSDPASQVWNRQVQKMERLMGTDNKTKPSSRRLMQIHSILQSHVWWCFCGHDANQFVLPNSIKLLFLSAKANQESSTRESGDGAQCVAGFAVEGSGGRLQIWPELHAFSQQQSEGIPDRKLWEATSDSNN